MDYSQDGKKNLYTWKEVAAYMCPQVTSMGKFGYNQNRGNGSMAARKTRNQKHVKCVIL